ncbi:hypothetical protein EK904_000858 [Melospiza melodia maxima]|nr:hypothetical protein EK904_000858 [Melospiza melodia maxima]
MPVILVGDILHVSFVLFIEESRSQSKSPAGSPARVKSESRSGSRSPSRASKHSESHSRSRSKSRWTKLGNDFMGTNRENTIIKSSNVEITAEIYPGPEDIRTDVTPVPDPILIPIGDALEADRTRQSTGGAGAAVTHQCPTGEGTLAAEYVVFRKAEYRHNNCSLYQGSPGYCRLSLTCWFVAGGYRDWMGVGANPDPNTCLGVFGLSLYTTERDLREVFSRYGPLTGVNVVYDQRTGRSRGFAFVYFERIDDSKEDEKKIRLMEEELIVSGFYLTAMEHANGMELDGRRIRVDYSITKRAHTPTPGIYMGRPTHGGGGGGGAGRRRDSYYDRGYDRGYDRYEEYDYRYRRRSPSPYYSRYRSRSRSRSYSPRRY